jgi:hypothetical protein
MTIESWYGDEASADIIVSPPTQPNISQQVVDNNVLLRWNDCTASLPIVAYELRRGAVWATATVIGTKQGGFTSVFETLGGTYTYWLAGIDSAGNYGTPGSVAASVQQPPDYVLRLDQESLFSGTKVNALLDDNIDLLLGVSLTETYEDHFTSRSWTTPQAQIDAGYAYWIMPSTESASYEEVVDYGAVVASSKVSQTLTSAVVAGTFSVTPKISVKLNAGDAWTDFDAVNSVYTTNFRYIKFRYDFASAGGDDLMLLTELNYRLDSKLRNDFGTSQAKAPLSGTYSRSATTVTVTATAHGLVVGELVDLDFTTGTATDGVYTVATATTNSFTVTSATSGTTSGNVTLHAGGTPVNFAIDFVDVEAISVTPSGTTPRLAIYDFVDAPNPTTFKALLFDTAGNRVSGPFSWSARGV